MKKRLSLILLAAMLLSAAFSSLTSCTGIGDSRDRNLERETLARTHRLGNAEFIGLSDVNTFNNDGTTTCQCVVIYFITDSAGNKVEHNARVTSNNDGSEIYAWEELDTQILGDVKHRVNEKMKETGINLDGSLIDAVIAIKKQLR